MLGSSDLDAFHELCFYTLAHTDPTFIHQHAVDAYAAQTATPSTKPMALVFALVGLHLMLDRGKTGREVQRTHMLMANRPRQWPSLALPEQRGTVTVHDVVAEPPGPARDRAVRRWCQSVWSEYSSHREKIADLLREFQ